MSKVYKYHEGDSYTEDDLIEFAVNRVGNGREVKVTRDECSIIISVDEKAGLYRLKCSDDDRLVFSMDGTADDAIKCACEKILDKLPSLEPGKKLRSQLKHFYDDID